MIQEKYLKKRKDPCTIAELSEDLSQKEGISGTNAKKRISRSRGSEEIPSFQSTQVTSIGSNFPVTFLVPPDYLGALQFGGSGNVLTVDYTSGNSVYPLGSLIVSNDQAETLRSLTSS